MSGNSRFPKDPDEIIKLASEAPSVDKLKRYEDSSWSMAVGDLLYSFSNVFVGWPYPHYRRSDKRPHPIIYFPAIGRRLLFANIFRRQAQEKLQSIIEKKVRYFVFPLQLEHDFQIVAYSPFDSLGDAMRMVLKSFAEHADDNARLLLKVHPWDPGLKNWRRLIFQWADEFGIGYCVDYFDGGDLDEMLNRSAGMVTVNSTSGIRALQLGCPVMVLGEAIYNVQGLTHQEKLDSFWTNAKPPEQALVDAFMNAMAATIQIRGVFFSEPGMSAAVREAVNRLYTGTVGMHAQPRQPWQRC